MIYSSGKDFDQSVDGEEVPSPFGDGIICTAPEPFQIIPYTRGITADHTAAVITAGD